MEHKFQPSQMNALSCIRCRRGILDHTDFAQCEACPKQGPCELYPNSTDPNAMLLCAECIQKEKDYQSPDKQEARLQHAIDTGIIPPAKPSGILNINDVMDKARTVDYSIKLRDDIHNAETIATHEVFQAIDANPEIPASEKQFAKAKFLTERQAGYQKVIFEHQEIVVEHQNRNRVLQQKINELVNTLRAEEREKLKVLSPDYKPGTVKPASQTKPRASKTAKFDKKSLIEEANKLVAEGHVFVDLSYLQSVCVSRQMTPVQAADFLRQKFAGGAQ